MTDPIQNTSHISALRERIRRLEDWHHIDRCRDRWSTTNERQGRRLTVFGPEDGFASYSTNDRELWEVIEALNGVKEMDDESLVETARRVCNPEVHATIRDGIRDLMLKDLLDGLKQRGFPKLKIDAGGSVAAAILRSIDERIDAIIKANQEVADDEHRAAKVERDGLIAQVAELRRSGVSEAESESVLRANELEAECDRLRDEIQGVNRRATRHLNKMGWIRNQVIRAVQAMDSGANPLEACQRSRPILDAAIAETPAVPDGQHDPHEVERLERHVAELAAELKVRDRTLGQLADIAEERDALLVRVETLEQQAGRRPPNPMESTAPPDAWKPEWQTPYENLVKMVRELQAKVVGPPDDDTSWSKLVNHVANLQMEVDAFKRYEEQSDVPVEIRMFKEQARDALRRIARIECLLCGEEGSGAEMIEEEIAAEDRPSYRQIIAEVDESRDQCGALTKAVATLNDNLNRLIGVVELDGKAIHGHAERIKELDEWLGACADRLKDLDQRTTIWPWRRK
jgi:hypothetical protein